MRTLEGARRAAERVGCRVEMCACGGRIVAVNDDSGIAEAVQEHQSTLRHRTWFRAGVFWPCGRLMRYGRCGRTANHPGWHRSRQAMNNTRAAKQIARMFSTSRGQTCTTPAQDVDSGTATAPKMGGADQPHIGAVS